MTLRELWATRELTVGGWCHVPNSFTAELMGRAGYDWVCVDTQHGFAGQESLVNLLQALDSTGTPAFVRVAWNEPHLIMRVLDSGAQGVIVPLVNTAADAEGVVRSCLYAPEGIRSWGPTRAALGRPDYNPAFGNQNVVRVIMIETREAVENLDEILKVSGIDGVFVGPKDLAISYGLEPTSEPGEPRRLEVIERISASCRRHDVIAGISCDSLDAALRWHAAGYSMFALGIDSVLLRNAAAGLVAAFRARMTPALS